MTSPSAGFAAAAFSATVVPPTVSASPSSRGSSSRRIVAPPPASSNSSRDARTVGPHRAQQRRLAAERAEQLPDVDVETRLDRDRLQVLDRVHRAADREHRPHPVAHGAFRDDLAGAHVALDEVGECDGGGADIRPHLVAQGAHRRGSGHREAESLGEDVHRVRGREPRADARAEDRVFRENLEVGGRLARHHGLRGAQEDLLDVGLTALRESRVLVAARDDDRRDVEPARRHEVRRGGLVARTQADHRVEFRALDGGLDVVDDEVAARQDVAAGAARARDEVATAPSCGSRTAAARRRAARP